MIVWWTILFNGINGTRNGKHNHNDFFFFFFTFWCPTWISIIFFVCLENCNIFIFIFNVFYFNFPKSMAAVVVNGMVLY